MITNFFPGRIRLRAAIFKDADITDTALTILKRFPAVTKIEHNPATGSILLVYDPLKVPTAQIERLLPILEALKKEADCYTGEKKPIVLSLLKKLEAAIADWET